MKKLVTFFLIAVVCLSLVACGNKLDKQADEVAEKLDGVWGTTWNAPLGEMTIIVEFDHSSGNAGKMEYYYIWDGDVITHYTGTYGVSIQTDGIIDLAYIGEITEGGAIQKLEKIKEDTLTYSYEDGKLKLMNSDGGKSFVKIED